MSSKVYVLFPALTASCWASMDSFALGNHSSVEGSFIVGEQGKQGDHKLSRV